MKKLLLLITMSIVSISILFISSTFVFAEEKTEPLTEQQMEQISQEVNKYIKFNEVGKMQYFDTKRAENEDADEYILEMGNLINEMIIVLNVEGTDRGIDKITTRALFPIGAYGNYCGKGNNGWNKKPIDDLDSACREHDKCFKGFSNASASCNRAFIKRLLPIWQSNPYSKKGLYAGAAITLFKRWT